MYGITKDILHYRSTVSRGIFYMILLVTMLLCHGVSHAATYKVEAENGTLANCEIVSDAQYSGGKAVRLTEESSSLTISVDIEETQRYKVFVMADGIGGEKTVNCSVNGIKAQFKTNALSETLIGTFKIKSGKATINITPSWTWFDIDYVRLETDNEVIPFDIQAEPVTSNASDEAKNLYSFLYDNFGKRTISGVMSGTFDNISAMGNVDIKSLNEVATVYNSSGYYPVLVGFDFMNATGEAVDKGNTWFTDYTKKNVALAKDLWKKGGIPDFSWHWRDPGRSTGEFYTSKTTFDFTQAINSDGSWKTNSTIYKNMIKDIDTVADYFLEMQSEGMACIFRPLHEAPGGWFWWGAHGSEPYVKLYQLIYNEMVNVKGVRNVIWDWNADYTQTEWCPGEEYFDIVSTDIYNNAYDYSSNAPAFDMLKTATNGKKIIALAENGPIPDIDNENDDEAIWSWWMPWCGEFIGETSDAEWTKCMSDSRVITLEDMEGWTQEDGITGVPLQTKTTETYFNIIGQPVNKSYHGIVIKDGKKIINK